jgi:allantoicase
MGDGWETRRRRSAGHDWIIVKLATAGMIKRVLVDTCHFKGNYPDSFTLEGAYHDDQSTNNDDDNLAALHWVPLIDNTKLKAHSEHSYQNLLNANHAYTHVRLNIFPDGGVSRLRIFGEAVFKF